jgi:hypothetical protein
MNAADLGLAVVQNYLWGQPVQTLAAMQIGPNGRSEFLDAQAGAFARHASMATAVFDDIKNKGGDPSRVLDELDRLP